MYLIDYQGNSFLVNASEREKEDWGNCCHFLTKGPHKGNCWWQIGELTPGRSNELLGYYYDILMVRY
jgi:hypothetical protein